MYIQTWLPSLLTEELRNIMPNSRYSYTPEVFFCACRKGPSGYRLTQEVRNRTRNSTKGNPKLFKPKVH